MFIVVKRKHLILLFLGLLFLIMFFRLFFHFSLAKGAVAMVQTDVSRTIVIDAGHGGEDGGALSADGTIESHINLSIAKKLNALFLFLGQDTQMTRTEDISIYSEDAKTLRQKKASDLKNRAALVNSISDAIFISIHQNSLPTAPSVRGAYVFFNETPEGNHIATSIQEKCNQCLNLSKKTEKQISPSIYLMKNVKCPAVLVECGFLSNQEETALLQKNGYQKKIALAIASGVLAAVQT